MDKPKKSWQKPELIVLVRSNPAEAVLSTCKGGGQWQTPTGQENGCRNSNWAPAGAPASCGGGCSGIGAS